MFYAMRSWQVVGLWREDLRKINPKAAEALADPSQYANLFPNMAEALQAESLQVGARLGCKGFAVIFVSHDCCWQLVRCLFLYVALMAS